MSDMATSSTIPQKGFFGHPRGLATLFATEMWERFSYYGMKAILLYYMTDRITEGGLSMGEPTAAAIISVYGASIYMAAIAGGWVADRLLGARKSVLYGGILIMFGHVALALPLGKAALYTSMVLLVLGTGLLKPNISNSVGELYPAEDRRRDAGFSIFYMGISVGAVIAPLVVGTLGQRIDYHVGFGVAAIGMLFGLVQYVRGGKHLGETGKQVPYPLADDPGAMRTARAIGVGIVLLTAITVVLGMNGQLTEDRIVNAISALAILLPVAYFTVMLRSKKVSAVERSRVISYIPLYATAICFWLIQEQGYSVLAQYADTRVRLDQWGFAIPSSWFQSVGSFVLIVLTPLFAVMWTRLGNRVATPWKFAAGLLLAGLSYLWLVIPVAMSGPESLVNPMWLVMSFAVVTVGEMCLSPVGMSATNRLAPKAFQTQTMGLWLASNAAGQGISAQVVQYYTPANELTYFLVIGLVAIGMAVALALLVPFIKEPRESHEPAAVS